MHVLEKAPRLVDEGDRSGIEIDKEKATIVLEPHGLEVGVFRRPVLQRFASPAVTKAAVRVVGPLMIGAGDEGRVAAALEQRMGTVAAHVVKGAQHPVVAPDDEDTLIDNPAGEVISASGEIADMPQVPPLR